MLCLSGLLACRPVPRPAGPTPRAAADSL